MSTVVDSMWTVCGMPQHSELRAVCQLQAWTAEPRDPETHMPETQMYMSYSQGKLSGRLASVGSVTGVTRCLDIYRLHYIPIAPTNVLLCFFKPI